MKMQKVSYKGALKYTKSIFPIYSTYGNRMFWLFTAIKMLNKKIIKLQKLPIYSKNKNGFESNYYALETKQTKLILAVGLGTSSKFEQVPELQIIKLEQIAFKIVEQIQKAKNKASIKYKLAKELESILNIIF